MTLFVKRATAEIDIDIDQELASPSHVDHRNFRQAYRVKPAMISLKDSSKFPNKQQYPIILKQGKAYKRLLQYSLVMVCWFFITTPCTTPILSVRRKDGSCRLAEDLGAVNRL